MQRAHRNAVLGPTILIVLTTLLATGAAVSAAERCGDRDDDAEAREWAERCAARVQPADVELACGLPVTVNAGAIDCDATLGEIQLPFAGGGWGIEFHDVTRCAKRFDAGAGRRLWVTIGQRRGGGSARSAYELNQAVVERLEDYAVVPDLGDAARRFRRGGQDILIRELEFAQGQWLVSVRTAEGVHDGEVLTPLCGVFEMEQVAHEISRRLRDARPELRTASVE